MDFDASLDYYLQLQQVEAALTSDPTNDELLKLKADLLEVIELTKELSDATGSTTMDFANTEETSTYQGPINWKVGEKCLAPWSQNGKYYEAVIEEILPKGKVSVGYPAYSHGDCMDISLLKPLDASYVPPPRDNPGTSTAAKIKKGPKESLAERKVAIQKQKEYLKKRKQKKLARVQSQETEREKDKKKWLSFSNKKGLLNKKKSIFASPQTVDGRVGIGTCGMSGKPMTEFSQGEKWRKGWRND